MKNFGFGCMRFPLKESNGIEIDYQQVQGMVDRFIEEGFTYFDTAHGYMHEQSEGTLKKCLTSKYRRDQYILTDKLTSRFFEKEEDILPLFHQQLEACGVDYFDYYLMHALNAKFYEKYTHCHAFDVVKALKKQGRVKHIGISFHDSPEVLEKILSEHEEIEVVQIQYNYFDLDNPKVHSQGVYDVCLKYDKKIIIMEPCKGGRLVQYLPPQALAIFDQWEGSPASFAIRFVAEKKNVMMVLSGVSTRAQIEDNMSFMKNFTPLSEKEHRAIEQVTHILKQNSKVISCTQCGYCTAGCVKKIDIPRLFALYNHSQADSAFDGVSAYTEAIKVGGKASSCIKCGACEAVCPQHLPIREFLSRVSKTFESNQ